MHLHRERLGHFVAGMAQDSYEIRKNNNANDKEICETQGMLKLLCTGADD